MSKIGAMNIEREEALADAENEVNEAILNKPAEKTKVKAKETITKAPDPEKTEWAIFKDYIDSAGLIVKKSDGSTYLKAEAWLYLAMLKGLIPSVETQELMAGDEEGHEEDTLRVKATCKLLDKETGRVVSQSDMFASREEDFLKDKPEYAVYGMAETRAITRAVRNVYGYVVRGIGYESTPAIEMGLEEDVAD